MSMHDLHKMTSLNDLLKEYFQHYPFQKPLTDAMVRAIWKQMMSRSVCDRTEKIYMHQNKLFIKITSPVLRHELQFGKNKILNYFKEYMTYILVEDIVFL